VVVVTTDWLGVKAAEVMGDVWVRVKREASALRLMSWRTAVEEEVVRATAIVSQSGVAKMPVISPLRRHLKVCRCLLVLMLYRWREAGVATRSLLRYVGG
jgi:hypothetical protein